MLSFPCGGAAGKLNTSTFPQDLQLIAGNLSSGTHCDRLIVKVPLTSRDFVISLLLRLPLTSRDCPKRGTTLKAIIHACLMQGLKGWESKNTKVPWSTPSEPNGVSVSSGVFLYIFYIWLLSLYWTQILLVKIILNTETPCLFVVIVLLCLFSGSQEYLDTYKCQLYIPKRLVRPRKVLQRAVTRCLSLMLCFI